MATTFDDATLVEDEDAIGADDRVATAGEYEQAIAEFRECITRDPALITCHSFLAATYALTGRIGEAQWEADEIRGLEPGFTLKSDNVIPQFLRNEDRERYINGLRKSGIMER